MEKDPPAHASDSDVWKAYAPVAPQSVRQRLCSAGYAHPVELCSALRDGGDKSCIAELAGSLHLSRDELRGVLQQLYASTQRCEGAWEILWDEQSSYPIPIHGQRQSNRCEHACGEQDANGLVLHARKGAMTAVLGPSSSGKTLFSMQVARSVCAASGSTAQLHWFSAASEPLFDIRARFSELCGNQGTPDWTLTSILDVGTLLAQLDALQSRLRTNAESLLATGSSGNNAGLVPHILVIDALGPHLLGEFRGSAASRQLLRQIVALTQQKICDILDIPGVWMHALVIAPCSKHARTARWDAAQSLGNAARDETLSILMDCADQIVWLEQSSCNENYHAGSSFEPPLFQMYLEIKAQPASTDAVLLQAGRHGFGSASEEQGERNARQPAFNCETDSTATS
ncbi:hypothetical protein FVE85_1076 [Porphyridium purpureum]|uniref:Uncharacterized protein n=1 Tax=Porphyridium purpureum TaxID=35688 RepID=A0A5J4Z3X1_PORPP|nr:hypothetical protein FVE85_1076 [Porphyridium purpureum]|eukprot:POR6397..scf208_2